MDLRQREAFATELMDEPGHSPAVVAENLGDLRRANRWFGGTRLSLQALGALLPEGTPIATLRVLDVGTGAADIPRAMVEWGRRRGVSIFALATDLSEEILAQAQAAPGVSLVAADGCQLPLADDSVDVACCSLMLHHKGPDEAAGLLAEMNRVARLGVVVNDLVRGLPAFIGAWIFGHVLSRNELTRNDAPLSVRRAYSLAELEGLLDRAGLVAVHREQRMFRAGFAATARPSAPERGLGGY